MLIFDESQEPLSQSIHFDRNTNYIFGGSLIERMGIASKLITTQYAIMCSDDDFIIKESLYKTMIFLENNKDYVSCIGDTYSLFRQNEHFHFENIYIENKFYDNNFQNIEHRIKYKMAPYKCASFLGLNRSPVLSEMFHVISEVGDWDSPQLNCPPELSELLAEIVNCFYGKSIYLNQLLIIRSQENQSIWITKWGGLRRWFISNSFSNQRNNVVKKVQDILTHKLNMQITLVNKLIDFSFITYMDNNLFKNIYIKIILKKYYEVFENAILFRLFTAKIRKFVNLSIYLFHKKKIFDVSIDANTLNTLINQKKTIDSNYIYELVNLVDFIRCFENGNQVMR